MIDDGDPVVEDTLLQPLPGWRVQHLAGREDALETGQVVPAGDLFAVPHKCPDGGRRGEQSGHAELLDEFPEPLRAGLIQGAYVADGAALEVMRLSEMATVYHAYEDELARRGALDRPDGNPIELLICASPEDEAVAIVDAIKSMAGPHPDAVSSPGPECT